jgi:hypothetical protein
VSPARPAPRRRRSVTWEILGRWVIALALVPVVLPVVLLAGGHITAAMLIWSIAIMTLVALVRGRSGRR